MIFFSSFPSVCDVPPNTRILLKSERTSTSNFNDEMQWLRNYAIRDMLGRAFIAYRFSFILRIKPYAHSPGRRSKKKKMAIAYDDIKCIWDSNRMENRSYGMQAAHAACSNAPCMCSLFVCPDRFTLNIFFITLPITSGGGGGGDGERKRWPLLHFFLFQFYCAWRPLSVAVSPLTTK